MSSLRTSVTQVGSSWQEMVLAIEQAPSLAVMMLAAWRLARRLAVALVEEVLAERAQRPTQWPQCEQCGAQLESKGLVARGLTGLMGTVRWERRVGRCPQGCQIGQVAPLDTELGLQPHQQTRVELKRAVCARAVFVPFEVAAVLLRLLTEVVVSPGAIWHWVQAAGHDAMTALQAQLEALQRGELPEEEQTDAAAALPLLIGADGVRVPFRPQGGQPQGRIVWREIKVGILARLHERVTRTGKPVSQWVRRRLVAVLGAVDDRRPRRWLEAVQQGLLSAQTVVWLCDGGRGFWNLFRDGLADYAIGILDFYHAAQNLWQGARAWLDGRTRQAQHWFAAARRRLRRGEADQVLGDIAAALALEGLPASARKTLENLYTYLETHRDPIDYARFKEWGLPIGSGMVESACKWLIQQRFKGVGMRWSEDGFNHLLHLRLAWVNGRFATLFPLEPSPNS